jgi:hypothetical protein
MSALRLLPRLALVLALVASTQSLLLVQSAFLLNRSYIAATLCVNRDVPDSACNGTCYLSKQMKEQHDQEQRRNEAVLDVALAVALWCPVHPGLTPRPATEQSYPHAATRATPSDWQGEVFHPPRGA